MKRIAAVVASAVLLSSAAYAGGTTGTGGGAKAGMKEHGKSAQMMMPKDEKSFAERLHHVNQMEVRWGELAQQKGSSESVREFGRTMAQDHQQADQQLMTLAKTRKWKLSEKPKAANALERATMEAHRATEAKLKALDGPAFDSAYMAAMVNDHDMVIMKLSMAAEQFQGTPLAEHVAQVLPKLQQHREEAYRILGEVKAEPEMGVGGAGTETMPQPMDTEPMPQPMEQPTRPTEPMPDTGTMNPPNP